MERSRLTRATATFVQTGFPQRHRIPLSMYWRRTGWTSSGLIRIFLKTEWAKRLTSISYIIWLIKMVSSNYLLYGDNLLVLHSKSLHQLYLETRLTAAISNNVGTGTNLSRRVLGSVAGSKLFSLNSNFSNLILNRVGNEIFPKDRN